MVVKSDVCNIYTVAESFAPLFPTFRKQQSRDNGSFLSKIPIYKVVGLVAGLIVWLVRGLQHYFSHVLNLTESDCFTTFCQRLIS